MASAAPQTNADKIAAFLESKGLSMPDVAGILGNLQVESGFNPTSSNPGEGAIGIAQWEGGRRTALDAYAKSTGGSETSLSTQLGYLWSELTGPYSSVLRNIKSTSSPGTAAAYWDVGPGGTNSGTGFENSSGSATGQRMANADAIYQKLTSGQSLGGINNAGGANATLASFTEGTGSGSGGLGPGSGNIGAPVAGGGFLGDITAIGTDIAGGTASAATGLPGEIESVFSYFLHPVIKFLINAGIVVVGVVVIIIALVMLAHSDDHQNPPPVAPSGSESHETGGAASEGGGAEAAEVAAA